jgi:hypothetical protein
MDTGRYPEKGLLASGGTPRDDFGSSSPSAPMGNPFAGASEWLGQPAMEGGPNRLEGIGRVLGGLATGWNQSIYGDPSQRGSAIGNAFLAGGNEVSNMKNAAYQQKRQEMLDLIAQQKTQGKTATNKNQIIPPGATVLGPDGKPIYTNPGLPKEPPAPTGDMAIIKALAGGDPEKERQLLQEKFDKDTYIAPVREPAAPRGPAPERPSDVEQAIKVASGGDPVKAAQLTSEWLQGQIHGKGKDGGGAETPVYDENGVDVLTLKGPQLDAYGKIRDATQSGEMGLKLIDEMLGLNDKALSGKVMTNDYMLESVKLRDPEGYAATKELQNKMSVQAIESLRGLFQGLGPMSDRDTLLMERAQTAISETPEVRAKLFKDMRERVDEKLENNRKNLAGFVTDPSKRKKADPAPVPPIVAPLPAPPERQVAPGANLYDDVAPPAPAPPAPPQAAPAPVPPQAAPAPVPPIVAPPAPAPYMGLPGAGPLGAPEGLGAPDRPDPRMTPGGATTAPPGRMGVKPRIIPKGTKPDPGDYDWVPGQGLVRR